MKRKKALNINVILNNMISTNSFLLLLHQHICLIHSLQEFMEPCHLWHFAQALHDSELTMSLTKSLVLVWALCKFLSTLSLCVCDSRKIRKNWRIYFRHLDCSHLYMRVGLPLSKWGWDSQKLTEIAKAEYLPWSRYSYILYFPWSINQKIKQWPVDPYTAKISSFMCKFQPDSRGKELPRGFSKSNSSLYSDLLSIF